MQGAGAGIGYCGEKSVSSQPDRELKIPKLLLDIEGEINSLHNIISNLSNRLDCISVQKLQEAKEQAKPVPSFPLVIERMYTIRESISMASTRLSRIIEELEI